MLSVVIPAYNEEGNIKEVVGSILGFLPSVVEEFEIIVVDDGSKDGTGGLIDHLSAEHSQVIAVHHASNRGYGAALRTGFKKARGDFILFTDGDGQFDIKEFPKLTRLINRGADIACGYRVKRADPVIRAVNARVYNVIVRIFFGLSIKDIDCAFKLFKKEVVDNIELKSEGAFISSEFLIRAKQKGYTIQQVGVSHFPRQRGRQTGSDVKVVLRAFGELFRFWRTRKRI